MRGWLPIMLGVLLAAGLILLSEWAQPPRIAPAGAVAGLGGYTTPGGEAEPIAPPDAPLAAVPPAVSGAFSAAPPGERRYIPILMYHYVRYVDAGVDPLGYNLSVTPEQFDAQLGWLRAAGYEAVRMDAVAACVRGVGPCPARGVALTFDDGYMDAYTDALPILQRHGYTATFYIVSGFVGQPGYMGWDEIRALRNAGMEIGAHSVSHPDLTSLGLEDLRLQVGESGAAIASALGQPVQSFCYPAGRFSPTVAAVVAEAGFSSATTTNPDGPQGDPFALPRLRISGGLSHEGFQWMLGSALP
jgi:peptidoglycan/xylan/chitin deacetylase (PgdA/CDA1 family)